MADTTNTEKKTVVATINLHADHLQKAPQRKKANRIECITIYIRSHALFMQKDITCCRNATLYYQ